MRRKDIELQELQDKCNYQSKERDDLERECDIAFKEIKQLRGIVESRFPDEVEDGLLGKIQMYAESTHHMDKLEQKLKKAKQEREEWKKQTADLQTTNQGLSHKLHKAIAAYERLKQQRNMNNKVFLELDDIVTVLNNITIESDFPIEDENDNVSMKNIRRKIQAIEGERQKYANEVRSLREETGFKDAKISSLESKFYDPSKRSDCRHFTNPTHKQHPRRVEYDDDSVSSSDSSTIEPPPISLEMYEETRREYESALQDMVKLTEELNATNATVQEYEKSSVETEKRFNELSEEYKETLLEMSNMRRDYNKVTANYDDAVLVIQEMKEKYDQRLREMTESYSYLEENYNKLKDEQADKLMKLETEVSSSERFFEEECKRLKKEHELQIESIDRQVDGLRKEHAAKIGLEKRQYEDLRLDFESVRDRQSENAGELKRLREKYEKSLKRIVQLEETLKHEKESCEQILRKSSEEAKGRYQQLQQDYNALLAAKRSAGNSEASYRQNLETQYAALEEKHRRTQAEAVVQYQDLRSSYDASLTKIGSLEKKVSELRARADFLEKNQSRPKSKYEIAFDEISNLERDLFSNAGISVTHEGSPPIGTLVGNDDAGKDKEKLKDDSSVERSIAELIGWEHISNFLQHQRRLFCVHKDVQQRQEDTVSTVQQIPSDSSSFFGSIFLEHDLDINDFKSCQAQESAGSPKNKIAEMLNALAKIKLNAVIAQIQYQAREKELKTALMQYKRSLRDMQRAKTSMNSLPSKSSIEAAAILAGKADPPVGNVIGHSADDETDSSEGQAKGPLHKGEKALGPEDLSKLNDLVAKSRKRLNQAKAKVEAAKHKAEEAQQEQLRLRSNFQSILVEFKASEANMKTQANEPNKPGVASVLPKQSFDCGVSMLTSSCASSTTSGEGRDEKVQGPNTKSSTFSNDAAEFIRLKQEYDVAMDKISSLQNDLRERETESELATQKLENREGDLRDVIQRYKDLHEEYKKFLTSDDPYSPNNAHVKLIQERDAARWKVSEVEGELRQAKVSVTSAVTKQNLAKQHLRDVIFQYKTLQREHEALVQRIEGLRVDLPSSNASSSSSRQKNSSVWRTSSSSQEEKRDTASPQAQHHLRPIVEADDRNYLSARSATHPFVNDIESVRSFGTADEHSTKSSKKKPLYKSLYKEVKKSFVKPVKPRRREVVRIDGLS
ncbi:unnamed protein product [Cylindrotheca closterium]|uniref:Uncharacterized protein n=1 Tax=Cylindrotheca closterium TaxID=2856 RepID=A0AAD2FYX6_9STRA|nr:unnamed protein product [Cylindrotheca closterium]